MATAIPLATLLPLLRSPAKAVAAADALLGYKGENSRGDLERQLAGGSATSEFEGEVFDEYYFNNTGSTLAAGDWVGTDTSTIFTENLDLTTSRLLISGLPEAAVLRRMKQAPAASDNVLGILMESTANDAWGRVRRFGPVSATLNGVTPNMDGTLTLGAVQALQIHGSTAGKATQAPPTLVGTLEVLSGASTGTVSVGTAYNGRPAFAVMNEADGTVAVLHAIVAAGTLTVTLNAVTTGDRTVAYRVEGPTYGRVLGYQLAYDANLKFVQVTCL